MALVQLSFACGAKYKAVVEESRCSGNSWWEQWLRQLGYNYYQVISTGLQSDLDDCWDYSFMHQLQLTFGNTYDDFTTNDDCSRIFQSGSCDGLWINKGYNAHSSSSTYEKYECYCYQSVGSCSSSEVAVGDEDQGSLADMIQQLKHEGDQNAALMQLAMQRLAAEGSKNAAPPTEKAEYQSENDALKKANKVLLNTLKELEN